MVAPAGFSFVVVHNTCGQPAFYSRAPIGPGLPTKSEDVVLPDGSHPAAGTCVACGSCGGLITGTSDVDVQEVAA